MHLHEYHETSLSWWGGAEYTQQIMLTTKNLNMELRKHLVVAFTELVHLDNNSIKSDNIRILSEYICMQYPYNSCDGIYTHKKSLLEVSELQPIELTDKDKFKWIQDCHVSLVTGYPGRGIMYHLLSRSVF
jgi:hypothetical protein